MRINQNIAAFNSYRNLSQTNTVMGKSLEKLSSGFRINRAADDAAGLVISQGLRAQVSGLRQATRNAQDGISVVQTAEGALNEVHSMLNRMRDLAVQASNGSNDADARAAAQAEINELASEIGRISETTRFGQIALLNGDADGTSTAATAAAATFTTTGAGLDFNSTNLTFDVAVDGGTVQNIVISGDHGTDVSALAAEISAAIAGVTVTADGNDLVFTSDSTGDSSSIVISNVQDAGNSGVAATTNSGSDATSSGGLDFQVGANSGDIINIAIAAVTAGGLGVDALDVTSFAGAQDAIDAIDIAISSVSTTRGTLGAVQNRFESTIANLQVTTENLAASESRIRDTDMALEMVSFTRHQILLQAGTAMLGQANALPQSVLRLLG
jgi:flagellin